MIGKKAFFLLLVWAITACNNSHHHPIQFYYWKSNVEIGPTEKKLFSELQSEKLYIRLFDVDNLSGSPQPKGVINPFDADILKAQYIPVVYITNRTFTDISSAEIEKLAQKLVNLVQKLVQKNKMGAFDELQIDCDWTTTTQKNYFSFLEKLAEASGKKISCTLRLHQVKFKEKTGIPPVKKVYLMCYATSSPLKTEKRNSILDMPLLRNYLKAVNDYPIDFDIALPIYSWAIVTNHVGKIKLLNGVDKTQLSTTDFKKINDNLYEVRHDVFLAGVYLNKGFWVKVETISPGLLAEAKTFLDKKIQQPYNLIYYHLDGIFLERYALKDLK